MPVIAIFSGLYCAAEEIVSEVARRLDYPVVGPELLDRVSDKHGVPVGRLSVSLGARPSLLDQLLHDRSRGLIQVKDGLAELLQQESLIYIGGGTLLIPAEITHTMRVCLHATMDKRVERAGQEAGLTPRQARKHIERTDQQLGRWARELFHSSPWEASLYDLLVPTHTVSVAAAADLICQSALVPALRPTPASMQAALDYALEARAGLALQAAGHPECEAKAHGGAVSITINKRVLRVDALMAELRRVVAEVEGVTEVEVTVGAVYNRPDIISAQEFDLPGPALLVDDEVEFVLTLSERLGMRDLPSEVVYNGQEALAYLEQRRPDVMVLDLRMPGMGGMDVLRQVKGDHPEVEVIVLTGHGGEAEKAEALSLGAFAFMRKPVAIQELAETMRRAREAAARGADDKTARDLEPGEGG